MDDQADLPQTDSEGAPLSIERLLTEDLDWIRGRVRLRLGALLRQREDSGDLVHEVVLRILRNNPRFVIADRRSFRGLVAHIAENVVRSRLEYHTAQRRDLARETAWPDADEDGSRELAAHEDCDPESEMARNEERTWMRLGIELLSAADREVIVRHEFQGESFVAIGAELGLEENTARMRFVRALQRLARRVALIKAGAPATARHQPCDPTGFARHND